MTLLVLGIAFILLTVVGLPISFAVGVASVIGTFLQRSAAATIRSGTRPSASWNRSISRIGSLLSPASAAKDKALTGARSRASLTAAQQVGRQPMRPG